VLSANDDSHNGLDAGRFITSTLIDVNQSHEDIMKSVVHRIPLTRARINLGQVVRRAYVNREYFILEKDGIPVAGIMNVDDLEDFLELRDPHVKRQIRKSSLDYRRGKVREASGFLATLRRPKRKK
jgi:hypothetical protein